jgi:hypothetical protein
MIAAFAGIVLVGGWSGGVGAQTGGTTPSGTAQAMPAIDFVGKMSLSVNHGVPGTIVTVTGEGLPPKTEMLLVWGTARGSWVIRGAQREEYHGRRFEPVLRPLRRVVTDAQGGVRVPFTVPIDFGFVHNVMLIQQGVIRNQAAFNIDPQARVTPASGPAGTPIQIVLTGVGYQNLENSWMVVYDNKFTGWLSSVTTGGVARAVIPAAGEPGKHVLQIIHGSFTVPYMNMQQSPRPERPSFSFDFTLTPGKPVLPAAAATQALPLEAGRPPHGSGAAIWTDVASGPVGTPFRVLGRGLPPGRQVQLDWTTVVGNRVAGDGWSASAGAMMQVVVDRNGEIALSAKAPDDLGGPHTIIARIGEDTIAETTFTIRPSALPLTPNSGPVGTTFTVHLKGVGWTETANIYHVVYDNAYIGYACGFNSQGDVQVLLKATGTSGWHFVDLYPGIYKGREVGGVQNFRTPQLTYAADHPGERLPAFRFAFFITK